MMPPAPPIWNARRRRGVPPQQGGPHGVRGPVAPPHVEETVAAIAELHAAHYREAGALQRFVSAATAAVSRPRTLAVIAVALAAWLVINLGLPAFGQPAPDPFPFHILAAVASTLDLFLAAMILVAQRHEDELADRRDQLTLEIAILSEQKTAKIIALLEAFRRNDPHQSDARDEAAEALAEPSDPHAVLGAIEAAHGQAAQGGEKSGSEARRSAPGNAS
jgi:uncharacterized membrane protein